MSSWGSCLPFGLTQPSKAVRHHIMDFSDTTNLDGLVEQIDFFANSNSTKYPLKDKARNVNVWYRRIVGLIWKSQGNWTFDDVNNTTLPVATTTLVDNQRDYGLPTAAGSSYGEIERVEILDNGSNYYRLQRIELADIGVNSISEFEETKGKPRYYYLQSNSIILLPAPNTSLDTTAAAGLKIYLTRDIDEFVSTDTTQEPGFNRNWHIVLAHGGALDYIIAKTPEETNKIKWLQGEIEKVKLEIADYYVRRNDRDDFQARRVRKQNYR